MINLSAKQKLVKRACDLNPRAVNDDMELAITVWRLEGADISDGLKAQLKHCTRSETLSRRRRELFQLGLLNYDEEALEQRSEAYREERDRHSSTNKHFYQTGWL